MSDLERAGRRGYSWPPFEPGHELSTLHGAKSPRKVDPIAEGLVDWVTTADGLEHLREPRFLPAVWAWARVEATVQLLSDYCAGLVVEQATVPQRKGASSSPLEILRQHEATAATMRARLGLDPMSAAKLLRELTETSATARFAGLEAVREQGRQARLRRIESIDAPPSGDGGDAA